ncbi:hypothetical protein [Brevibacillus fortis]|uniref:hypothetical protein n=1 Tax=Brevibacillus fortis TaxID=2126352 RepID=UPI0038FD2AFA
MSDDLDSLLGAKLLELVKGYVVNYFYNFRKLYVADKGNKKKAIGVDIALMEGKTWDNHITLMQPSRDSINEQSANLNSIFQIDSENYTAKYAGSTCLQIWSYYDIPLPPTDVGKMILLAIDSTYLGHYIPRFQHTQNEYLEMMSMTELIDLLNKYDKRDFEKIKKQFCTNHKIFVRNNGFLRTSIKLDEIGDILNLDLSLPDKSFVLFRNFKDDQFTLSSELKGQVFSLALTNANGGKYTYF